MKYLSFFDHPADFVTRGPVGAEQPGQVAVIEGVIGEHSHGVRVFLTGMSDKFRHTGCFTVSILKNQCKIKLIILIIIF